MLCTSDLHKLLDICAELGYAGELLLQFANNGRDVALASFDDTPLSSEVSPAVTSVDHHAAELAERAVRLLFERADDPSRDWQRITVPGTLAVRESTQLRP